MSDSSTINSSLIQQWITDNLDQQKITSELQQQGLASESIEAYLREYNKAKIAKRQAMGGYYLAAGSILGFISCLLTMTNPIPSLYYVILYGLTSVVVVLICIGLYLVFE
jgi:hypothetical protein